MKKLLLIVFLLVGGGALILTAKEEVKAAPGSIRPTGKVAKPDLPAMAKISFEEAAKAALAAAPGKIIQGELEVEDGNLQYSFEVVGADKKITEVEVDAGNGKILATDKDYPLAR